jgi:hypothetical protein
MGCAGALFWGLSGIAGKFADHELMRASLRRSLSK